MSKTKSKMKLNRRRNLMHDHPLLRKGGVHQKSNKSKRQLEKLEMKKECLLQNTSA